MIKDAVKAPVTASFHDKVFQKKMKETCADFESLFLSYMLKTMRAGISQAGMGEKSHESGLLYSMLDEKLSEEIAQSGGIGLADVLYDRLIEQKQVVNIRKPGAGTVTRDI
ncbi:MAG: peptidoglycan hydrolase FlgJ [Thermodesulfobacteriota bacterium]|nr:peptidoglycan hydrolase FlgJ [Thermodesulfobacteriota bacterium]